MEFEITHYSPVFLLFIFLSIKGGGVRLWSHFGNLGREIEFVSKLEVYRMLYLLTFRFDTEYKSIQYLLQVLPPILVNT